jgi:hypothetical protein
MQHTNKVPVLEVVAVQLVAGLLRIHNILIDNEGGALGVARNALSNLTVSKSKQGASRRQVSEVDIPDGSVLPEEVEQLLWSDVVAGPGSGWRAFGRMGISSKTPKHTLDSLRTKLCRRLPWLAKMP